MDAAFAKHTAFFYQAEGLALVKGDAAETLGCMRSGIADMVFADPPYFLSNGGITCSSGKMVSVDKGDWDREPSRDKRHAFSRAWIRECKRVLSDTGTIWISGTLHNIYDIGTALEEEGFKILNNITWQKTNPPPNLSCRYFTHSTETILWARKDGKKVRHYFDYAAMKEANGGKQMKDVWSDIRMPRTEKAFGKHPTQKPLALLERIILASTKKDALVVDPFCGSSTTGVAALRLGRRYIGIDSSEEYLALSRRRLEAESGTGRQEEDKGDRQNEA